MSDVGGIRIRGWRNGRCGGRGSLWGGLLGYILLGRGFRVDLGGGLEGNFRLADVLYCRSWRILYGALGLCASAAFLETQYQMYKSTGVG